MFVSNASTVGGVATPLVDGILNRPSVLSMTICAIDWLRPPQASYTRTVFEAIIKGLGTPSPYANDFYCDDKGVWVAAPECDAELAWHPRCETLAPGSPNPLDVPWLPFPFSARDLAAWMVDGWGYFVREKYGDWNVGPDSDELRSIGPLGAKAKEALTLAYEAGRLAISLSPRLDRELASTCHALSKRYNRDREAAISKVRLRERGIADDEYTLRLAVVNEAVEELKQQVVAARKAADEAEDSWRRAMVQHLLLPVEQISAEAFGSSVIQDLQVDRRAEAVYQVLSTSEFVDSEAGRALWVLLNEKDDVEQELHEWTLLHPRTVTEKVELAARKSELQSKLGDISRRLAEAESPARPPASPTSVIPTLNVSLLATPQELVNAFGSRGLKLSWFKDLASRAWLKSARKVTGRGQRGHLAKPLFCPLEVMNGLVNRSRKSNLRVDVGWRILEDRFPLVYEANSFADPRDPTG